ncbi:aldo-keto reductase AKR2E4-like [Colias croceus]|uniref:aldo-keto reductase AKR2E4-like n=1 Tax=Colias crocea TaxID=72248 RepID=UPI001E27A4C0|nr:aldo-keto reductase AKR2E4-like [Colias croceus]
MLNDGNLIPTIAYGTDTKTTREHIIWAVEAGFRHIDTAKMYENEEEVGKGIADLIHRGVIKREDIFITTKLLNTNNSRDEVVPELKGSLQRLGLDYVDLYLIHSPMAETGSGEFLCTDYVEVWRGMEEAKSLKLAKSIGISNFNSRQINRILSNCNVVPAVNEIEVNPTYANMPLVSYCQQHGINVMAYTSLGHVAPRGFIEDLPPSMDDPVLVGMAKKYNKTSIQVVLRYSIDRDLIPIVRSQNKSHIEENINVFDFRLTQKEIYRINEYDVYTKVHPLARYKPHIFYSFYEP